MDDFNERMQRLTERHEALAQSVELFQHEMRELKETVTRQGENIDKLAGVVNGLTIESAAQQQTLGAVLTAMQELIGLVAGHERRIGKLESA